MDYLSLIIFILLSSFNSFLEKKALHNMTKYEFLSVTYTLRALLSIVIMLNMSKHFDNIKQLGNFSLLCNLANAIISVFLSLMSINLIKNFDINYIVSNIDPLVMLATVLMGYFIFGEDLTKNNIIGMIIVMVGLFVMNN